MAGYSVTFTLSRSVWMVVEPVFGELFEALSVVPEREDDMRSPEIVTLFFEERPDENDLREQLTMIFASANESVPQFSIEALPDVDWLQRVYDELKPIEAGRFFVHGSHIAQEDIPQDKVAILIEAASAFGTGEHPSTKGCLLAFDKLLQEYKPTRVLDMGCGSGILAIAAARTCEKTETIVAIDIDPGSVIVAKNHAEDNGVESRMTMLAGDGFRAPEVLDNAPYDLVFANILAQPLIEMSYALCGAATRDIILAGFTENQMPYVLKAYEEKGCVVKEEIAIGEWRTVWLQKK